MICAYCGKEIDDGERFCPYCGKEVGAIEEENTDETEIEEVSEPAVEEPVEETPEPEAETAETEDENTASVAEVSQVEPVKAQKKSRKGLIIALVLLLLAGGGFAVTAFVYPGFLAAEKVAVDFNDLIKEPEVTGYNTEAKLGDIGYDQDKYDALLNSIEKEENRAVVEDFLKSVTFTADKAENLRNGDTVTIVAGYDEQLIEQIKKESKVKIEVTDSTKVVAIKDLEEKPKFSAKDIGGTYLSADNNAYLAVYPIGDYEVICQLAWIRDNDPMQDEFNLFFSGKLDKEGKFKASNGTIEMLDGSSPFSYPEITARDTGCELHAKDGSKLELTINAKRVPQGTFSRNSNSAKCSKVNITRSVTIGDQPVAGGNSNKLTKGDIVYICDSSLSTIGDPINNEPQGVYYLAYSPKHGKFGWINVLGTDYSY